MKKTRMVGAMSLTEAVLWLALAGIVAGAYLALAGPATNSAKAYRLNAQLSTIKEAMNHYYTDTGTYPCGIRWLIKNPNDEKDAATGNKCYDSLSLKAGAQQDEDVLAHWGGPYLKDQEFVPGNSWAIKSQFGQAIAVGAKITNDGVITPLNPTSDELGDQDTYYNILTLTGLQADHIRSIYSSVNGRGIEGSKNAEALAGNAIENFADALKVAKGETDYEMGVGKFDKGKQAYMVYRFTRDFSGK